MIVGDRGVLEMGADALKNPPFPSSWDILRCHSDNTPLAKMLIGGCVVVVWSSLNDVVKLYLIWNNMEVVFSSIFVFVNMFSAIALSYSWVLYIA